MRAIRTATINHNDDQIGGRVRLELRKEDGLFVWFTEFDEDCGIGSFRTVHEAEGAALIAWGSQVWDFRAAWMH